MFTHSAVLISFLKFQTFFCHNFYLNIFLKSSFNNNFFGEQILSFSLSDNVLISPLFLKNIFMAY